MPRSIYTNTLEGLTMFKTCEEDKHKPGARPDYCQACNSMRVQEIIAAKPAQPYIAVGKLRALPNKYGKGNASYKPTAVGTYQLEAQLIAYCGSEAAGKATFAKYLAREAADKAAA